MNYFTINQLKKMGIKCIGNNIMISKKCSIYNPSRLTLHDNIRIDDFSILSGSGTIEIFNYVHIACHCFLTSSERIVMSNFSGLSSSVKLFGSSSDYSGKFLTNPTAPKNFLNNKCGDIILEDHSIIGSNSVVLPNVTLKEGSVLGSLSLCNKNLDEWSIYAGNPAKFIKTREKGCLLFGSRLL